MMLNMMSKLKWKMLAIPKANPRRMHSTPSLFRIVSHLIFLVGLNVSREDKLSRYGLHRFVTGDTIVRQRSEGSF